MSTNNKINSSASVAELAAKLASDFSADPNNLNAKLAAVASPAAQRERARKRSAKTAKPAFETQAVQRPARFTDFISVGGFDQDIETVSVNASFAGRFSVGEKSKTLNAVIKNDNGIETWIDVVVPHSVLVSLVTGKQENGKRDLGDGEMVPAESALVSGALGSFIVKPCMKQGKIVKSKFGRPMFVLVGGIVNSLPAKFGELSHGGLQYVVNVKWSSAK